MLNSDHLRGSYFTGTEDTFLLDWSMSRAERYALLYFLQKIKPATSIEIGTYNGGSLQAISLFSDHVYAIDNDPSVAKKLDTTFSNVTFTTGDSKQILPQLIANLREQKISPQFVLIDGDHSTKGVYTDLRNILCIEPLNDCYIFLHDTFNPQCRKGIKQYDFSENAYIHYIDIDFVPGEMINGNMWGGLGLIILKSKKRSKPLIVNEAYRSKYNRNYYLSIHFIKRLFGFFRPLKKLFS